MQLLDDLQSEHVLIDRVLGSFRTWVDRMGEGGADPDDGRPFVKFFVDYAGAFHHEREEEILFPALEKEANLPVDRGPIATLLHDHERMGALLAAIRAIVERDSPRSELDELRRLAVAYSHSLWLHIDAENSVLLPESELRLRRNGVWELEARGANASELETAANAEALTQRYPPLEPDLARGEGCALCPSYGSECGGVEREWWNEWEWEEMDDHLG
jgi:hemerythrin-like domain-containing protein